LNFEVRPYRQADQPMGIEIARRTWGGCDHLPVVLDKMVADPHCPIYVIEYKKKTIALGILRIVMLFFPLFTFKCK
jgi:hypothetical protein